VVIQGRPHRRRRRSVGRHLPHLFLENTPVLYIRADSSCHPKPLCSPTAMNGLHYGTLRMRRKFVCFKALWHRKCFHYAAPDSYQLFCISSHPRMSNFILLPCSFVRMFVFGRNKFVRYSIVFGIHSNCIRPSTRLKHYIGLKILLPFAGAFSNYIQKCMCSIRWLSNSMMS